MNGDGRLGTKRQPWRQIVFAVGTDQPLIEFHSHTMERQWAPTLLT